MTLAKRLYELGCELPPAALAELIDFAEFLQHKRGTASTPTCISLAELRGGLEDSATFAAPPMTLQERMRREWD